MSITFEKGDILQAPEDFHVVIPVNCAGVAGKGLALQWAQHDPYSAETYKGVCAAGQLSPGGIWVMKRWVLFATKDRWQNPSQMEWISSGLHQVRSWMETNPHVKVAMPPIGAGLGGLDPRKVLEEIRMTLFLLPNDIRLYGFKR